MGGDERAVVEAAKSALADKLGAAERMLETLSADLGTYMSALSLSLGRSVRWPMGNESQAQTGFHVH